MLAASGLRLLNKLIVVNGEKEIKVLSRPRISVLYNIDVENFHPPLRERFQREGRKSLSYASSQGNTLWSGRTKFSSLFEKWNASQRDFGVRRKRDDSERRKLASHSLSIKV
ncbi:hypothetical protein AVEN_49909-1 [Araneus ventricosus]|uniref:Uncharacterized protein n=1 Tax=Araneus ventricosus TaxID=182803 RepID=A0A4Y2TMW1_ARAVE|nr:hypothetical protein AVEN_49909-1 [Araneus ventricosus]